MKCPHCRAELRAIEYEGVHLESCDRCGGEWLDSGELSAVVRAREARFDPGERQALARAHAIEGVKLVDVDRDLVCPKCGATTDPINYGGDTGIVIDRCTGCSGLWLDGTELEKVQQLVEGWEDCLPEDLAAFSARLHQVAAEIDRADDVSPSRLALVGPFINALINRILDIID